MTESSGDRNPVEFLAEEFIARKRRGEKPTLTEYTAKYPDLAEEIREVFPALLMMEDLGDSLQGATGPHGGGGLTVSQIGDYRILREVGRGGMGVVYEAEQMSLGRHVALKVLPHKLFVDAQQRRCFEREAKAAAKLHHTNIVPVFGVGEHDGIPYYVMQFIQGLGLDDVLEELKRLHGGTPTATGGELRAAGTDVSAASAACSLLTGTFQGSMERVESPQPGASASGSPESRGTGKQSDSFPLSSAVKLPGSDGAA